MKQNLISSAGYKIDDSEVTVHFHNEYEIIFIEEGEIELTINKKVLHAVKNDIIFISNLENHSIKILKSPYKRYFFTLSPALFDKMIGNIDLVYILKSHPTNFKHCFNFESDSSEIKFIFTKILREFKENTSEFSNELIISYLKELLIIAYRKYKENFIPSGESIKSQIYSIQKYIDENFQNDIKIHEICNEFYINHYYLTHCFKKFTGFSPKQYLTLTRLNNAGYLLVHSDITVCDAALESGFSDVNNFIRCFKSEYNMTPKEYKKQMKNN